MQTAEWRLAFRPSLSVLRQTVSQLRTLPRVTDDERNAADDLLKQSSDQAEPDVANSDFRKYDDGLRMILDCTPALAKDIGGRTKVLLCQPERFSIGAAARCT